MKRPIAETYCFVRDKLLAMRPIPLRKRVCLFYLKWSTTKYKTDRDKFVELIQQWRKESKLIGSHRTLLERKARRLFQQVRKDKNVGKAKKAQRRNGRNAVKNQTGVHSPEQRAILAERNREIARRKKENGVVWAHHWIIHPPEGEPFKIYNLNAFCREHGLNQSHMCRTAIDPKRRKHHKGWRAEKYDPTWEKLQ
jgi:hypothetical protein